MNGFDASSIQVTFRDGDVANDKRDKILKEAMASLKPVSKPIGFKWKASFRPIQKILEDETII